MYGMELESQTAIHMSLTLTFGAEILAMQPACHSLGAGGEVVALLH